MTKRYKKSNISLPSAELDVMKTLWKLGEPSTVPAIHRGVLERRKCTAPAVHILVDRLEEKGFVKVDRIETPVAYKLVTALVTEAEYCSGAATGLIENLFHGSWKRLIANLAESGEIKESDIKEIEKILKVSGEENK